MSERESRETQIPKTSLAQRGRVPGEVTVRFLRWTPFERTACQKGQLAGFMRPIAEQLVAAGAATIVDDPTARTPVQRASRKFGG